MNLIKRRVVIVQKIEKTIGTVEGYSLAELDQKAEDLWKKENYHSKGSLLKDKNVIYYDPMIGLEEITEEEDSCDLL